MLTVLGGNSASTGYNLTRSLRFRSSASAYLSRTPASASNRQIFTFSGWVKRGTLGARQGIIVCTDAPANNYFDIEFIAADQLDIQGSNGTWRLATSAVYRDPSAWYHIVLAVDTTQATASNRVKLYVNGSQVTAFSTASYPTLNSNCYFNLNAAHSIGSWQPASGLYFDGYMTEVNFIDGQALTPSSFGSTNTLTGVWQPAAYTGSYGTNGFYLPFTNITSTLLSNSSNISAPFGGVATNALVADGVYCTSNTSVGAVFTFLLNDFGTATQVTSYSITSLYFTGGGSTFLIQSSPDNSTWTTVATLSVTGTAANFSGALNAYARYFRLYASSFGSNGQAAVDAYLLNTGGVGLDFSGNGNAWIPNNISITAGVTYDSMTDVPTLTSATAANFAVLNPLNNSGTLANANLTWNGTDKAALGTMALPITGKYYFEATCTTVGNFSIIGIADGQAASFNGVLSSANFRTYNSGGEKADSTRTASWGSTFTSGDVIGIAVDMDNGAIYFAKNNTWQASGVPTSGASKTGAAFTDLISSGKTWVAFVSSTNNNGVWNANHGQRPFTYTPPTGFVALNTFNLPTSTIVKGNTVMDATTYTGTGASLSVTNTASFKPDLVWVKSRSAATDHAWYDSVRGVQKQLESNTTTAETTETTGLTAFGSAGFTVGALAQMNTSAATYVGWQWQAGQGSSSSNTNGTITSTVSVNASAGFSVVTYTTPATNTFTIGHGLGVAPSLIFVKGRNQAYNWDVYHASLGATGRLVLNTTAAFATTSGPWANTAPTSTVFSSSGNGVYYNTGDTLVAYCWTPIAGYSAFGSYNGSGSADGPFIYTNFQPKFVLIKASSTTSQWVLWDTARNTYNVMNSILYPNLSNAEYSFSIDILSNGFKFRESGGAGNDSGVTYIYAAFATSPFKNSLAR